MEKLFYELLQVSVGQLDCLSRGPSTEEWLELYQLAQRQAVAGVCYKGVERLFEFGLRAPQDVSIDWMSEAEEVRMGNAAVDKHCATLQKKLLERKIYNSVLLGQGVARCYGDELQELRQPNGIDVFVDCSLEKTIKLVQQTGQATVRHSRRVVWLDAWKDTEVRMLPQAAYSKNPLRNAKVQRWFKQNKEQMFVKSGDTMQPSADMNVAYVLQHLHEQFLYGRVDMRLLMDCFFIMKQSDGRFGTYKHNMTLKKVMSHFGMKAFAGGMMWVMQEVFAMNGKQLPIAPREKEGRFILQQVMGGRRWWQMLKHYPLQMVWALR